MSHSTTATTTYVLTKYSRSYPSTTSTSQQSDDGSEWQHFTNPVIRLVLDVKKTHEGKLESYRMRILWTISSGQDVMDLDQPEVVFEDLELISFSSMLPYHDQRGRGATVPGLPLKAVYRDCVVGIRYLHPRVVPQGTTPMYRRVQINFENATSASGFIDAIRLVCPVKANLPPPSNLPIRAATMMPTRIAVSKPSGPSSVPLAQSHNSVTGDSAHTTSSGSRVRPSTITSTRQILRPAASMNPSESQLYVPLFEPLPKPTLMARSMISPSQPDITTSSNTSGIASQPHIAVSTPDSTSHLTSALTPTCAVNHDAASAPFSDDIRPSFASHVPISHSGLLELSSDTSLPSSSPSSSMMPPPPLPPLSVDLASGSMDIGPIQDQLTARTLNQSLQDSRNALIDSLCETPPLYDLPRTELERLVAQIVREEGFVKLLESLDSMWRIKGFLGHA